MTATLLDIQRYEQGHLHGVEHTEFTIDAGGHRTVTWTAIGEHPDPVVAASMAAAAAAVADTTGTARTGRATTINPPGPTGQTLVVTTQAHDTYPHDDRARHNRWAAIVEHQDPDIAAAATRAAVAVIDAADRQPA